MADFEGVSGEDHATRIRLGDEVGYEQNDDECRGQGAEGFVARRDSRPKKTGVTIGLLYFFCWHSMDMDRLQSFDMGWVY